MNCFIQVKSFIVLKKTVQTLLQLNSKYAGANEYSYLWCILVPALQCIADYENYLGKNVT